jgi:arsenate reductase
MKLNSAYFFIPTRCSIILLMMFIVLSCSEQANHNKTLNNSTTMEVTKTHPENLYPELLAYISTNKLDFSTIPEERKSIISEIASYIKEHRSDNSPINLIFICTHNSRRSHMSQLWSQAAADYYGVGNIHCFSGGTEVTAFNPRAVKAMQDAGFRIIKTNESLNPVYQVSFSESIVPFDAFSKKFSDPYNPQQNFIAVMTCSEADAACPLVPGAEARFSLPYEDPKSFDNTPQEEEAYRERCRQISTEMFLLMSLI